MNAKKEKKQVIQEETYELHKIYDLKLEHVQPDPDQPRKYISIDYLKDLAGSIDKHGVLFPILEVKYYDNQFILFF